MSKRQGSLVFWSSEGVETNEAKILDLNLGEFLRKPQHRGYLRKAIDTVLRNHRANERKQTREYFAEGDGKYRYVVIDVIKSGGHVGTSSFSIFVDDKGRVSASEDDEKREIYQEIKAEYRKTSEGNILQGTEVSEIIKRFLKRECTAFAVKKGGGVWLVDERYEDQLAFIKKASSELGVQFRAIDFNKDGNEFSLQEVVKDGFEDEIEALKKDLEDTTKKLEKDELTECQLEKRKEKIESVRKKLEVHKENLREYYEGFASKLSDVVAQINRTDLKKESFLELLTAL